MLALASLLLLACKPGASDGLALVGATLIDGSGGPALPNAAIVIRGGRIEWVGDRSGFELPRKTREVDVSGRWIIPKGWPMAGRDMAGSAAREASAPDQT